MQPSVGRPLAAVFATCACAFALVCLRPLAAQAQIDWTPCENSNEIACGHLTVPLDPSGATPGTITLALHRHRAAVGEARTAIIALAGGPGQPALPFTEQFDELLGPIAATRDLIAFDQRGIGLSQPLSCHAFEHPSTYHSFGALIQACGDQLGPDRVFYTSADTVADIEAIRQAGGYEKLVLYGTSYGTKVAEEYAQEYPSHVEALVLDSVVPPNPEPFGRSTFEAIPRILRQVCADRACAGVTGNPVADLARVLARMRRAPLRGRAIAADGSAHTIPLGSGELVSMLLAGDFSQLLRAEIVASVAAAARGDAAPLARLVSLAGGGEEEGQEDFDNPLYYATRCEEQAFPWNRTASPAERLAQAKAALRGLGASVFAPFSAADALELSDAPACAYWPYSTPAPAPDDAPLPDVPTLILSGADDLRTPTANAREVAAEIPDAHLLVVPDTGHSVLGTEPTSCARHALQALFADKPIKSCPTLPPAWRPEPLPPVALGQVRAARGYSGLTGRTLHAVGLTLQDIGRQLLLQLTLSGALETFSTPNLSFGGLRAGWARLEGDTLKLHDYTYVPGVSLSGSIDSEGEDLQVEGSGDAHGNLHRGPHRSLAGTLGGHTVTIPASSLDSAAIVGEDARESSLSGRGGSAARSAARLLGWLGDGGGSA
ncbi:MAG TPA: alpha/beta fold hydrolase [Solirubrobacteraceae bacterium]|jgi:pimeloyl-ACP methyl ester carboxylesterase|nr:alpha/beta fold hydrolase [Solirubrobacteraceae bacterium]